MSGSKQPGAAGSFLRNHRPDSYGQRKRLRASKRRRVGDGALDVTTPTRQARRGRGASTLGTRLAAITLLWGLAAASGATQDLLPAEPITLASGRVVMGGETSVAFAPADDEWFNYTGYEQSTLRHARFSATTAITLGPRVQVLGELRTETGRPFEIYAMFVRVRPWRDRALDLQVGRVPPTFGAYARRSYGVANPLIGTPLPYQYLTSLRPDAVPATADDLLAMRGRGWRPSYPLGSQSIGPGVPLVSALSWDTGIQARLGDGDAQLIVAITKGTLASPRVIDDNTGKQLAARAFFRPSIGLELGVSAARGDFVSDKARRAVGEKIDGTLGQTAVGLDVEYSRGHWLFRAEGMVSAWRLPAVSPPAIRDPLRAWGVTGEAQYRVRPGLYVAGRAGHLAFSSVTGTRFGGRPISWDAPVTRLEVGGGYSLTRNIMVKLAYQQNWRDDEGRRRPVGRTRFVATQLLYWF